MKEIRIDQPDWDTLEALGVFAWPILEHDPGTFECEYKKEEICYMLEGKARIEPKDKRKPVDFKKGDLVIFPEGLKCVWKISKHVTKHFIVDE